MMFEEFRCPSCGVELDVMPTAYGRRAICPPCDLRWTQIRGETGWTAESR